MGRSPPVEEKTYMDRLRKEEVNRTDIHPQASTPGARRRHWSCEGAE